MKLADHFQSTGQSLFRWRSYVQFFFLPAWVLAFVHYRPLFTAPRALLAWQALCVVVALVGLAIRVHVVGHAPFGTSGRNQAAQKAESLNTTGLYSVVRHPLYLGNITIIVATAMLPAVWYLPVIVGLGTALYYERIMVREESFLEEQYGDAFRGWAARTPAIFPAVSSWTPSVLPFSWRTALRGEVYGLVTIFLLVLAVDAVQRVLLYRVTSLHSFWTAPAAVALALWIGVRLMKKHTSLLTVPGR